jgi:hypothetical protein
VSGEGNENDRRLRNWEWGGGVKELSASNAIRKHKFYKKLVPRCWSLRFQTWNNSIDDKT